MNNSPFHNSKRTPLPDAKDIEKAANSNQSSQYPEGQFIDQEMTPRVTRNQRKLSRIVIGLLVAGLAIGGILSIGVLMFMEQLNLADPPAEQLD